MLKKYKTEDKLLVAVDCIIFGFDGENLKILLVKRDFEPEKGKWSLMGGFLKKDETLDIAANRVLNLLTGLDDIYMEQLYNFSEVDRDPVDRTLSVAYFALINVEVYEELKMEHYSAKWFCVTDIPNLIFDHNKMVEKAISRIRYRAKTRPIGFELLPEKFTMRQLQKLYEVILGHEMDKRNFINKINSLNILIKLEEKEIFSSRKGSCLYSYNKDLYNKNILEGFVFKI